MAEALLNNRTALLVSAGICSVLALQSWRSTNIPSPFDRDYVLIVGLSLSIVYCLFIATRSRSWADRCVFGLALSAFVLGLAIAVCLPGAQVTTVLRVAKFLVWMTAAIASAVSAMLQKAPSVNV